MYKKGGKDKPALTIQTLQRMPYYLQFLEKVRKNDVQEITATAIARELGLNEVLVRKDLASVSRTGGKPRTGFPVPSLIEDIRDCMGYHDIKEAVLVGAGLLGKALLKNREFESYGLRLIAAFDVDPELVGKKRGGVDIYPMEDLEAFCRAHTIQIGIITVPIDQAQRVADRLVGAGIQAIWNFALIKLNVPDGVLVQNEDLACSLAMLSQHLRVKNQEITAAPDE